MELEKLKYPIGEFKKPSLITNDILEKWISDISSFPQRLSDEVLHLTKEQLETQYRPEGWTIRQVIHHCADSHMNSLTRFKLALTEDNPTIKPYYEARWAELSDSKFMDIRPSLKMLEGIHERWTVLLKNLTKHDLVKTYFHPDNSRSISIDEYIGIYAWHCHHHLAHITETKKKNHWS
jgi:hypothetical protein